MTILEASNRTGGRVHSSSEFVENHGYVELGAQFVWGEKGNPVFNIANENGFLDLSGSDRAINWKTLKFWSFFFNFYKACSFHDFIVFKTHF